LRAATYEHLLGMPSLPDAPELLEALEALEARSEKPDPARLAYLRDLLRRKTDPKRQVDPGWPERLREVRAGLMWGAFADLMTAAERKALMMAEERPRGVVAEVKPDPQLPRIRTIGDLPPGLLADLMSATGCQPKGRTIAIAEIGYDRDARPLRVRIASQGGTAACQRAMNAALSLDVAARVDPGPTTEVVLVRLDEGIPSCHESQATAKARPSRVGGRIQEPRKTKTVPPIYPSIAKGKRIQGLVVVQAVIEPTGCVASVELLQGANIHLDMEAVATVAAWRYTPTLLDGVAVPVLMTVTVNFKLN
jgi:TonB family protein